MLMMEYRSYTVELQWLEQTWEQENWFQSQVVTASQDECLYFYTLNSRDSRPIYGSFRVVNFIFYF